MDIEKHINKMNAIRSENKRFTLSEIIKEYTINGKINLDALNYDIKLIKKHLNSLVALKNIIIDSNNNNASDEKKTKSRDEKD